MEPRHSAEHAAALHEVGADDEFVLVEGAGHGVWPALWSAELADIVERFVIRVGRKGKALSALRGADCA
ncbi:MAG: hypothetical protein V9G19_16560 [Tetrasphaera sp.]